MLCAEIPREEMEQHFWLTRSVARAVGVNLSNAMADGRLTVDDYCGLVARCRAANCQAQCQAWLATQTGANSRPPSHCAHAQVFERLRQGQDIHS
jgi:hypothetical protein